MRSQAPRIPGVELLDELGAGARNLVFRGRRRGREAAIKLPRRRHEPEQTYEEYRREAGLQARVRGAGLPEVYEVGRSGATPFLVSEFVEGVSLAEKLKSGPLSNEQVRRLAIELAQTLGVVHERGLVHRDVKPSNVMLTPEGRARLIDFGLASRSYLQAHGTLTGTFLYAAPEQTGMLCRPVDGRADLYSLGALLFECLSGGPPFRANDAAELIRLHAVAPVPPLSSLCSAPAELVSVVEKLLAKDPDDRFENAWTLLNSLGVAAEIPSESVFLGRDQELARLEKEWGRALEGRGRMCVIGGESGCGKSMLVETFARGRSRNLVLRGKCDPTRTNPFALLLELFSGLPQTPEVARAAGESARLLAGFSPELAWLEPDGQAASEVDPAQYYQVLTEFWLALARQPLLVVIDDLQWLDASSAQILKRVMESLARTRCLLLATHRSPESSEFDSLTLCRLAPLTASQTEQLVTELLGAPPEANLLDQVILATGGNPLATVATVEAALDAGVFVPHWGGWRVESEGLTGLELSGDVMELVMRRLDHLDPDQRRVLEAAAVLGLRFDSGLLREVTRCAQEELFTVLAEACRLRLLEAHPGGVYRFVHDRVREALSGLDEEFRRELHRRAARALGDQPANFFARAEHYWAATVGQPDAATFQACEQAGTLALERAAVDEAYLFFTRAESSRPAGVEVTGAYLQTFGEACYRSGHFQEGMRRLNEALEKSHDPLSRADTHRQLALLSVTFGDSTRAVAHLRSGFTELGIRKANSPLGRALSTLGHLLGFGAHQVPAEAGIRLAVVACRACLAEGHVGEALEALAVGTRLARRVELCPSLVLLTSMQAVALAGAGWVGAAERRQAQAEKMAERLGDPSVQAQLALTRTFYLRTRGDEVRAAANSEECLLERGAWLATPDYLLMCGDLAHNLHFRGLPGPSRDWLDLSVKRARHENYPFTVIGPIAPTMAMLGRPAEARDQLERNNPPADASPLRLATHLEARLHLLLESGELGQEADRIIEEFDGLGLYIQTAPIQVRAFFILEGYARLRQSEAGPIRHQELKKALSRLARDRKLPLFRASHHAIEAGYERLCGRLGRAERLLSKAEELARRHDNLVVRVEVARQRAWILQAQGHQQAAWREARLAASMAAEVGWMSAAQTLERQFGLERRSGSFDSSGSGSSQSAMTIRLQRHLEALLEVTSAAHQTFDPVALGQLMLKELLRLFGAERAYLFLDERGQLTFQAGLSSAGQPLEAGGDYSRTVIERVARTGEPLLLSGTDDGEVLGSASVVAHDLRSIVAVPLALRDRSLGVVYLDSRLARGVFGPDDVSILQALAYQVAVTLEMARSASLEVQVRAEREQRRLAEQLSEFIGTILPLLEQEAILDCTLDLLESLTGYESAYVMLSAAGQFEAGPVRGQPASSLAGEPPELVGEGISLFSAWLKGGRSRLGMVVLERASDRPFTRREQELTLACLGYAGMAIENARLFADVERLATTDELTGANNRRHFFARAEEEFRRADRLGHSLCLALFDIDHFKKFNDTYGHAVGDLVLSTTSKRCQACLRSIDIMGRYGGEEFALVLVGTGLDDAVATADRLRRAVFEEPFDTPHGPLQVSISVGVALRGPDEAVETVLERADQALYRAKDAGRNRVERG